MQSNKLPSNKLISLIFQCFKGGKLSQKLHKLIIISYEWTLNVVRRGFCQKKSIFGQDFVNIEKASELPENQLVKEELVSAFQETLSDNIKVAHQKNLA